LGIAADEADESVLWLMLFDQSLVCATARSAINPFSNLPISQFTDST
jgi:hypothetical protein